MRNKDIYIQDSISSCGASCIRSVVSYYGGYVPLETVLEDTMTDKSGTNAYQIVRTLIKYGFDAYGVHVSLNDIEKKRLPVIAHVKKDGYDHFVVIYNIDDHKILTMNPEVGKKEYEREYFETIYDEVSIYMIPNGKIIDMKKSLSTYKLLFSSIVKKKTIVILFTIVSIFTIIIDFFLSFHLKLLEIVKDPLKLTIVFMLLKIIATLLIYLRTILKDNLLKYLDSNLLEKLLRHIFHLPIRYIKNKRVGEIIKKIEDMTKIKELIVKLFLICPIDLLLFVFVLLSMFTISRKLSIVYLFVIIIYMFLSILFKKKTYTLTKYNAESYEEYTSFLVEYIDGLESIKNIGHENLFLKKLNNSLQKYLSMNIKANREDTLITLIKNSVLDVGTLLVTLIGFINIDVDFTLVDLITFISLFSLLLSTLESIMTVVSDIFKIKVVIRNISEFLDVEEERKEQNFAKSFEKLLISDLSYSYDHFNITLNNINLEIKKGEKIFLNGSSGIGKSTLVKCISGIIDDYNGKITLNGIDIKKISLSSLKKQILYIGQNEVLFRDTIKENIVLGHYDEQKFKYICKITQVDEILNKRIDQGNTVLLEGASNISGGERSRIILARALYQNPRILIIDETLSSVSESMEDKILESLINIEELSIIYITHRDKKKYFKKIITL